MIKETIEKNAEVKVNSKEMEVLRKNFPSCFDKDGKFDIKVFEELIKTEDVDIKKEGYSLDFLGKSYARYLASLDSETVIVPDEGNKNINSENIYIVGDNLDALQHLKYSYSERIKCIYIDPPYNTGAEDDFVYNDKFEFTAEELAKKIGIEQEEAERVLNMQGKSTHSAWLTFMYSRLEIAKDLLSEDGCIFISIDDNEQTNLRLLCDQIFGESNFIGMMTLQSNPRGSQNSKTISYVHEYVLMYAKEIEKIQISGVEKSEDSLSEYSCSDENGSYRLLGLRKRGGAWKKEDRPLMHYPIYINPNNGKCSLEKSVEYSIEVIPKRPTGELGRWTWGKPKFIAENGKLLGRKVNRNNEPDAWDIFRKDYVLDEKGEEKTTKVKTIWVEKETNYQNAKNEIKALFGNSEMFDYPKPTYIMKKLINMVSQEDGDIVLDFFSGSASTAHAVFLDSVESFLTRNFIMVQLPETIKEKKVAYKAGYKTIDEIGRERIRRAAKKIKEENPEKAETLDLSFKTYYLRATDKQTLDKIIDFDPNMPLDSEDIKSKFGKDTVIETWKIKDGYGFNVKVEGIDLKGYTAYLLTDSKVGTSLYLIDDMPDNAIVELVRKIEAYELNVDRIIEYGYAFSHATNTALRSNLKTLKNRNAIEPIIRY